MEKAMVEIEKRLMKSGMSEEDASILVCRLLDEESRDYVKFLDEIENARENFIKTLSNRA